MDIDNKTRERRNILLIEDNPADARLVEIYLQESSMLDSALSWVDSLQKGLDLLEEEEFDVILLDLTLPDSQGFNTINTMIEEFPEYTIIVMTGLEDETLALNSVKAGAQDFIVKGKFDSNLLSRTISYAIERHQLQRKLESYTKAIQENQKRLLEAQKMARIGNWELDIVTNKMYWSDEVYRIFEVDTSIEPTLKDYLKFVEADLVDEVKDAINRTMEKGEKYNIEFRIVLPDGRIKHVANQGQIQMSQKSGSIVLIGTIQDISTFRGGVQHAHDNSNANVAELLQDSKNLTTELLETNLDTSQQEKILRLGSIVSEMSTRISS